MPAHRTRVPRHPTSATRILAGGLFVLVMAVPALSLIEGRAALKEWPYAPVRFTGDSMYAVLDASPRDGTIDSAFVGLAARAACPPTGPAALVLPIDDNTLHSPLIYGDRKIPWINQRLLDDMVAMKVERAEYDTALDPSLADTLLAEGVVVPFSDSVLAPPAGTVAPDERLTIYYLERDDVFVLVPGSPIGVNE